MKGVLFFCVFFLLNIYSVFSAGNEFGDFEKSSGYVYSKVYLNILGNDVESLVNAIDLGKKPSLIRKISKINTGEDLGSNYGQVIEGYIKPMKTGKYTFYISSDDSSIMYLGYGKDKENIRKIVGVNGYTSYLNFNNKSLEIDLDSGKYYYFKILHKEGGGNDHLSLAWSGPEFERKIIGDEYLYPIIEENSRLNFTYNENKNLKNINYGEECLEDKCFINLPDAPGIKYFAANEKLDLSIEDRRKNRIPYYRENNECTYDYAIDLNGSVIDKCKVSKRILNYMENSNEQGYYPGFVKTGVNKIKAIIDYDLRYNKVDTNLIKMRNSSNWKSTGLYLPAGTKLKITSNGTNEDLNGLYLIINIHTDRWRTKTNGGLQTLRVKLSPGEQIVEHNDGGLIFLENIINKEKNIEIIIEGAVPSPWFIQNYTKEDDWENVIKKYPAPMSEISGKLAIASVPSKSIRDYSYDEVKSTAEAYTIGINSINEFEGYFNDKPEHTAPVTPWRFISEIGSLAGGYASYPFVVDLEYSDWNLHNYKAIFGHGWRHEMCHLYQQRGWSGVQSGGERTVNICANGVSKIIENKVKNYNWGKDYISTEWGRNKNDIEDINEKINKGEKVWYWGGGGTYQLELWHKIGDLVGWDKYPEIYRLYREKYNEIPEIFKKPIITLPDNTTIKGMDSSAFVYMFYSEAVGVDLFEYFDDFDFFKEKYTYSNGEKDFFYTNTGALENAKKYIRSDLKLPNISEYKLLKEKNICLSFENKIWQNNICIEKQKDICNGADLSGSNYDSKCNKSSSGGHSSKLIKNKEIIIEKNKIINNKILIDFTIDDFKNGIRFKSIVGERSVVQYGNSKYNKKLFKLAEYIYNKNYSEFEKVILLRKLNLFGEKLFKYTEKKFDLNYRKKIKKDLLESVNDFIDLYKKINKK